MGNMDDSQDSVNLVIKGELIQIFNILSWISFQKSKTKEKW
jgi:hypothetical protein